MSNHPYRGRPPFTYWSSGVAGVAPGLFDPVTEAGFKVAPDDKVGTLGSCFAQHLARSIQASGYNYFVAETAPTGATAAQAESYGVFSARYGNVYTVRQALQLLERAFDGRTFEDTAWTSGDRWRDAFRPNVEPSGFESVDALLRDRARHLAAVRTVFSKSNILVFTLGLTEAWVSVRDGAVFPLAPGVAAGEYDSERYAFVNFDYLDVRRDLEVWIQRVKHINPDVRILLTVSPVPLAATFENRNVWTSTAYSKATLLAVARDVSKSHDLVDYFPSYEIITSPLTEGRYFADDLRSVREVGVAHVMRLFRRHYFSEVPGKVDHKDREGDMRFQLDQQREASSVICDEELLDVPDR